MVNVWTVLSEGQLKTEGNREKEIEIDKESDIVATLGKGSLTTTGYWDKS